MQQDGVRTDQVTQVRGYADQMLRVKDNPTDPSNRRISILVKNDSESVPEFSAANVVNGSTPLSATTTNNTATPTNTAAPQSVLPAVQSAPAKAAAPAAKPGLMDKLKALLTKKK